MPIEEGLKMLVIGNPFYFICGATRRTYEVIKAYSDLGIKVKMYIPYEQLFLTKIFQTIHNLEDREIYSVIESLEKCDIEIPEIYVRLESMEREVSEYYSVMMRGGARWILENFRKLPSLINKRAIGDIQTFIKENLAKQQEFDVDLIYVTDANYLDMMYAGYLFSEILGRKFFLLLQSIPLTSLKNFIAEEFYYATHFFERNTIRSLLRTLILTVEKTISKHKTSHIFDHCAKNLAGLLSISDVPIKIAKLDEWSHNKGIPIRILRPCNAVNMEIQKYFKKREKLLNNKEDYAIFYSRLDMVKGILDIPFIAKYLQQSGYEMLLVGRFASPKIKESFEKLCKVLDVKNIQYMGYLPDKDLWQLVAKSKVLIYPSHSDLFSLTILESLFLGNFVIAYNIPAICNVYNNLKAVRIVEEYNWKKMAEEAIKILRMDPEKFAEEHQDENLLKFLEEHSSWKNVARTEIQAMCDIIKKNRFAF